LRRLLANMGGRLAIAVTAAVVLACGVGAWMFSRHHWQDLLESSRRTARTQAELMRAALEHQMLENERDLIARMVATFARDPSVDHVRILDREGEVRFSTAGDVGERWQSDAPTCRACHDQPAEARRDTAVLDDWHGGVLRTVVPIANAPECQGCHDPTHALNGILIVDVRAGELRAAFDRDLRWLGAGTAGVALALLAVIGLSVRVIVGRRLDRFEGAARAIASGDLGRRVPVGGSDTLGRMAREFNSMADAVTQFAAELTEQRERLENVINSVDDGVVVVDPELRVLAANGAFLSRARSSRAELVGAGCFHTVRHACVPESCAARRCFATGERQTAVLSRVDETGATRVEELHASPMRSGEAVVGVVEVWRDITDRRAAEARLAGSHRMASLGMLASGFSHEMNTPLGTALTCVEGMLRTLEHGPAREEERTGALETAQIARDQLLRCRGITQQFLRLSRGQAAATELIALETVVESVVRLVSPTARERQVAVRAEPGAARTTVRASESELQQVLLNLVLNAVQACARGGHVAVEVDARAPEGPLVRVRDDGCGIAAGQLERIFEPFYGLRPGGTGLGLFLARDMARGWGATIHAASAPGAGAAFEVRFPRAGAASA
jgi:PAS domain S-box-containing protein